MTKKSNGFHISSGNRPAPCYAGKDNCPLKAGTPHFDSKKEADEYVEKDLSNKNKILHSKAKSAPSPAAMPVKKVIPTAKNSNSKPGNNKSRNSSNDRNRHGNRNNHNYRNGNRNAHNANNRSNNEKKYFAVVGKLQNLRSLDENNSTYHKSVHRAKRMQVIEENCGQGKVLAQFIVDKKHFNGNEIHQIKSNGCIDIYNENTGKHITTLIARPRQIQRCYDSIGEKAPRELLAKAIANTAKGYNYL